MIVYSLLLIGHAVMEMQQRSLQVFQRFAGYSDLVQILVAAVAEAVRKCFGHCGGSDDLLRCVEVPQMHFLDHLEHREDQEEVVVELRHDLPTVR